MTRIMKSLHPVLRPAAAAVLIAATAAGAILALPSGSAPGTPASQHQARITAPRQALAALAAGTDFSDLAVARAGAAAALAGTSQVAAGAREHAFHVQHLAHLTELAVPRPPAVPAAAVTATAAVPAGSQATVTAAYASTAASRALAWARTQAGKWYAWGGTGPSSYDCSGLVMMAYRHAGISLPRTTYAMQASWHLRRTYHPQPGDLAFYGSGHVELYVRPGVTFGAHRSGTRIGNTYYNSYWHPTAFYVAR
jgi:cell wall-associated NlpC family hydrolase